MICRPRSILHILVYDRTFQIDQFPTTFNRDFAKWAEVELYLKFADRDLNELFANEVGQIQIFRYAVHS